MSREPATLIGSIGALLGAVIVLLRSFGVNISAEQEDAMKNLALILIPLVTGLVIRGFVVSPATAKDKVAEAHQAGLVGGPVPSVKV